MKNLHLFSKTSKTILGALLFAASIVIALCLDYELERSGAASVNSDFEAELYD